MTMDHTTALETRPCKPSITEAINSEDTDSLWDIRWAVFEKAKHCLEMNLPLDALDAIHVYYQTYSPNFPEFDGKSYTQHLDFELRFMEANILVQLERYEEADSAFRIAISDYAGDPSCLQHASSYFAGRGRYADAVLALHQQLSNGYTLSPEQYNILRAAYQRGEAIPNGFMDRLRHLEYIDSPDLTY